MDTTHRPRRISIFWPLVLVAVGALWLLTNFGVIAGGNFWVLLRLWPVLLIAAGLDLLFGRRWPLVSALIAVLTVGAAVAAVIFAPQLGLGANAPTWQLGLPWTFVSGERGSGRLVTETREVSDFDSVQFSTFGDVTIRQGESESLVIEAEDNVLPLIVTEVRNGRLVIEYPERFERSVVPTRSIRYTLTVKNLDDLDHTGAGAILVQDLTTPSLTVTLSGAGNLNLEDLEAEQLAFTLSGAGNLNASGKVDREEITLSGFGNLEAGDLESRTAEVTVSGAGSASVWAVEELKVYISGAGSVDYYGDPEVSSDVSGLGTVHQRGDK
jgi:hypothetical protein